MHHKTMAAALVALSLSTAGAAFAQNGPQFGPGHDQRPRPGQRDDHRNDRNDRNDHRGPPPPPMHAQGRGAGPDHNFYRGGRLPGEYRNRQYVVNDWRNHHLSAPPRGYQWVQTGGDYVLVAIASGIIAQILLGQ